MSQNATFELCPEEKELPFSMIPNELIRNKDLSPNCRWLIIFLLSNSSNWVIRMTHIHEHLGDFFCKEFIYKIISEALNSGYLKREKYLETGLIKYKYIISRTPKFKKLCTYPVSQETVKPDRKEEQESLLHKDSKEQQREAELLEPAAPVVVPFIYHCLQILEEHSVTQLDKERLTKNFTEDIVKDAISAISQIEIKTTYIQSLNIACKNKWKPNKTPIKIIEENKKFAKRLDETLIHDEIIKEGYNFMVGPNYAELSRTTWCKVFEFKDKDFCAKITKELQIRIPKCIENIRF